MNCKSLPPLDDLQLLAYLDHEADERVIAHVQQCPACRMRAESLERTQLVLRANLYRASCPSTAQLRDFFYQLLSSAHAESIALHLEACPHCTREIFTDYVGSLLPTITTTAIRLLNSIKLSVATLVDSGAIATPAYAFRGGPEPRSSRLSQTHMFQVDDSMISLVVHNDLDLPSLLAIEGQALIADLSNESSPMQVHLWREDQLKALCVLDAAGDFAISRLVPGEYELILSSPLYKIKIPNFQVGTERPLAA